MRDAALLAVWLIGTFGLIGVVMAALARFVERDSMEYDKQFTWKSFSSWTERNPGNKK
ncbi:hypothetical protein [Cohnella lupini]|uniref:Uncharacterized protein n=1 Tax=Cohnella lupini TaxID=1294267 RepID=A0A3D9IXL6_9BACL|nr:hypothetical protein [Cohnella lupini]RED65846.1 hypothetical protein DFP95_101342 [Cohnella lupini]